MIVYKLTATQKNQIKGKEFAEDSLFNPIQDADGHWVITQEEVDQSSLQWVKDLPQIEYKPVPAASPFGKKH